MKKIYQKIANSTLSNKYLLICVCLVLFAYIVFRIYSAISHLYTSPIENFYRGFYITDYMINYQDGFIRRGLLGECLYQLFGIIHYPLHSLVVIFDIFVFILFILLVTNVFKTMRLCPLLPLALVCGDIIGFRRDFLMLILAYYIIKFAYLYIEKKKVLYGILYSVLSAISLIIYEPSFFFTIPFSSLIIWNLLCDTKVGFPKIGSVITTLFPIATMIFVCLSKGNLYSAHNIWQSWSPLLEYLGIKDMPIPTAIEFLSYSTSKAINLHLGINFGLGMNLPIGFDPILLFLSITLIICAYLLVINTPFSMNNKIKLSLSNIFLFQLLVLSPMFTILSCDYGRTLLYLVITCFFYCQLSEKNQRTLCIPLIENISKVLIKQKVFNINSLTYLFILIFMIIAKYLRFYIIMHNFGH